jgi:uncharacterized membrane protein YhaH (DUF805 family)
MTQAVGVFGAMGFGKALLALLLDPRGRISRQDMLVAATIMLAVDVGMSAVATGYFGYVAKALAYWIGGVAIVKRLHDVGRSGWWMAAGMAAFCMWSAALGVAIALTIGFESLQPGGIGYVSLLAALIIPALAVTLWLHFAAGEPGMNRFGAAPAGILSTIDGDRTGEEGAASGR